MMSRTVPLLGAGVAAAALALFAAQQARSQINTSPPLVPIGVSASGTSSTAWFHETGSRLAVACQTTPAQGSAPLSIHCVSVKLP